MNFEEQSNMQIPLCFNCQNQNSNSCNSVFVNDGHEINEDRKEVAQTRLISNADSDDECWCSTESKSGAGPLDTKKLWQDTGHTIKRIYGKTNKELTENHSTSDICKAQRHVRMLARLNAESLFKQIESIIVGRASETRNRLLKRFRKRLTTSNDAQVFISRLLHEYELFMRAAKSASVVISYLEEHYMKSFQLTWLLYNKHLYEKIVYMDKGVQHLMMIMNDLLHPSNCADGDYSPTECARLFNRFSTFDERISEITCLCKMSQSKVTSEPRKSLVKQRNHNCSATVTNGKEICTNSHAEEREQNFLGHTNSSTAQNPNDPLPRNSSEETVLYRPKSSGECQITRNGDPHQESLSEALTNVASAQHIQQDAEDLQSEEHILIVGTEQVAPIQNSIPSELSSRREKEKSNAFLSRMTAVACTNLPPKPPLITMSKLTANCLPLSISVLNKVNLPVYPSHLTAKLQSVSYTAETFGSITTHKPMRSLQNNRRTLTLNLSRKPDAPIKSKSNNKDNDSCQLGDKIGPRTKDHSVSSTNESPKPTDNSHGLVSNSRDTSSCRCDYSSDSDCSVTNGHAPYLATCSYPVVASNVSQRVVEQRERLKLKFAKRLEEDNESLPTSSRKDKTDGRPVSNNIDDLVRFIDGNKAMQTETKSKRKKKKKSKPTKEHLATENDAEVKQDVTQSKDAEISATQIILEQTQNVPPHCEHEQKSDDGFKNVEVATSATKTSSVQGGGVDDAPVNTDRVSGKSVSLEEDKQEEETNWITISRKSNKRKSGPTTGSSLETFAPIPRNNVPQKQQTAPSKKKTANASALCQPKSQQEAKPNGNANRQQRCSTLLARQRIRNLLKTSHVHQYQQKVAPLSVCDADERIQVTRSSTSTATASPTIPSPVALPSKATDEPHALNGLLSPSCTNANSYMFSPDLNQQKMPTFSPVLDNRHMGVSRCIQRPSHQSNPLSLPLNSTANHVGKASSSPWSQTASINFDESNWNYLDEKQSSPTLASSDFPLYDPFHSGADLAMLPSMTQTNNSTDWQHDTRYPQDNDNDEMDALDREIANLKKFYLDSPTANAPEQIDAGMNHAFINSC